MIKRLIFILLVCAVSAQGGTFGYTDAGSGGSVASSIDTIRAVTGAAFVCDSNATADTLGAVLIVYGQYNRVRMAIYTRDGTLLDSTEERLLPSSAITTAYAFELQNGVALSQGTQYVLEVWSNDTSGLSYSHVKYIPGTSDDTTYIEERTYDGADWPASASTSTLHTADACYRMWCHYHTAADATPQVIIINND